MLTASEEYRTAALKDGLFWPDYETARQEADFVWRAGSTQYTLLGLMGWTSLDVMRNPQKCIELYQRARPITEKRLRSEISKASITIPPISYGHANGLGCKLLFPETGHGDVGLAHAYEHASLEETIDVASREYDWETRGEAPYYIEFYQTLQEAFPDEKISFIYKHEGPLTTAYLLRGQQIFIDLMTEPEKTRRLLAALTDSIISYHRFHQRITGETPGVNPEGGGLADDIAAMVPADRFEDMVLPFWDRYYRGMTSGKRGMHVEDLRREQLRFVEAIGVDYYDPSISPKLTPPMIRDEIRVPFAWRLSSIHYPHMDSPAIRDWVYQAVADGAGSIFTHVSSNMVDEPTLAKVDTFIDTAMDVQERLDGGASRESIGELVSEEGRKRFWKHWPNPAKE